MYLPLRNKHIASLKEDKLTVNTSRKNSNVDETNNLPHIFSGPKRGYSLELPPVVSNSGRLAT